MILYKEKGIFEVGDRVRIKENFDRITPSAGDPGVNGFMLVYKNHESEISSISRRDLDYYCLKGIGCTWAGEWLEKVDKQTIRLYKNVNS